MTRREKKRKPPATHFPSILGNKYTGAGVIPSNINKNIERKIYFFKNQCISLLLYCALSESGYIRPNSIIPLCSPASS